MAGVLLETSCVHPAMARNPRGYGRNPFTNTIYVTLYQPHAGELVLLLRDDAGRLLKTGTAVARRRFATGHPNKVSSKGNSH